MKIIENCVDVSSKVKTEIPYDSERPLLNTSSKRWNPNAKEVSVFLVSLQYYLQ